MAVLKYLFVIGLILLFGGCAVTQEDVKSIFQTGSATSIKKDYKSMQNLLYTFKNKLDKRNPNNYNELNEKKIYSLLKNRDRIFLLRYNGLVLEDYKEYLQLAFSKDDIKSRNDFLILGIYYMIYSSYELEKDHKIAAFEYDVDKLNTLYKNLQILKWKIKVDKDYKGDYLFLTWQNNWQVELDKKIKNKKNVSYQDMQNLKAIQEKNESVLNSSNFSFEVILTQMCDKVKNSLKTLGEEPKELSIGVLKGMFLFL